MFTIERPLVLFDCETTGPEPTVDRIVELGFMQIKPDGSIKEYVTLINPTIPIPREASHGNGTTYTGHGITDEIVQGCRVCRRPKGFCPVEIPGEDDLPPGGHHFRPWPTFAQLSVSLLIGFTDCDFGGFNIKRFDLPLIMTEFGRCGHQWSYANAKLVDGFRLWQLGEARTLSDASEYFLGRKAEGAHSALDDVRTSWEVIQAQLAKFTQLPQDLAKLHELQYPINPDAIDPDGKIIWRDGVATMNFGKNWKGKPLSQIPRRDLQWIVNTAKDISEPVKAIIRDALAGKMPQPRLPMMEA